MGKLEGIAALAAVGIGGYLIWKFLESRGGQSGATNAMTKVSSQEGTTVYNFAQTAEGGWEVTTSDGIKTYISPTGPNGTTATYVIGDQLLTPTGAYTVGPETFNLGSYIIPNTEYYGLPTLLTRAPEIIAAGGSVVYDAATNFFSWLNPFD